MAQQPSGWGSTQNAANLPVVDAFARNLLMKYGGRTDDVWAFHDMPGYKQEIGGARGVIGGDGGSFSTGSGSVRISGMGRGGTPSDPGGYNWSTLGNVAYGAAQGVNWTRNTINTARQFNKAKKAQQMTDLQRTYANTFDPNMQYGSIYQGAANAFSGTRPGAPAGAPAGSQYTGAFPTSYPSSPGLTLSQAKQAATDISRQYGTDMVKSMNPALNTDGPRFAPKNGGFFQRQGTQPIQGSPVDTGAPVPPTSQKPPRNQPRVPKATRPGGVGTVPIKTPSLLPPPK